MVTIEYHDEANHIRLLAKCAAVPLRTSRQSNSILSQYKRLSDNHIAQEAVSFDDCEHTMCLFKGCRYWTKLEALGQALRRHAGSM